MKGGVEASAVQQDSKGIRSGLYTQRSESRDRGFGGVTPKDRPEFLPYLLALWALEYYVTSHFLFIEHRYTAN